MRRLFLAVALCLGLLVPASSAVAAPTGNFAVFNNCPTGNPAVNLCLYSKVSKGTVNIGKKPVPIVKPVTLQAGLSLSSLEETTSLIPGKNGQILAKVPQPVPGGLLGITAPSWWPKVLRDLFNETINNGFTGVTATMELAGPASNAKINLANISSRNGVGLTLPVKVKLDNPFLGSNCYIGSNSNPIQLKLTTGTTAPPPPNTPISGAVSAFEESEEGNLLKASYVKLVDNAFASPGVNGCGGILFSWAVDPFVDSIIGTPSPAGKNTAILEGETQLATAAGVVGSE